MTNIAPEIKRSGDASPGREKRCEMVRDVARRSLELPNGIALTDGTQLYNIVAPLHSYKIPALLDLLGAKAFLTKKDIEKILEIDQKILTMGNILQYIR